MFDQIYDHIDNVLKYRKKVAELNEPVKRKGENS